MAAAAASVTITSELWERPARSTDGQAELAAMRRLADTMANDPTKTFDVCTEVTLELCRADTCGISLREHTETGEDVFRWIALSGQLQQFIHGTMPRRHSPCGVCVDSGRPILMQRPEKVYKDLDVGTPFQDVLLVPLADKNSDLEGTLWIVAHNAERKFDAEDCRVMQRIAVFMGAILTLAKHALDAQGAASNQALRFQELDHRFKNALASMAGMIQYQLRGVSDPAARAVLGVVTDRVLALGQVHHLTASKNSGDLAEILKSVCLSLTASDPRFVFDIASEGIVVPTETATVVALIANELITNCVKHAFKGRAAGTVTIRLSRADARRVALAVTDDGAPITTTAGAGIGLDLISRFAQQIGGSFTVEMEPKRFVVVFPG